MYNDSSDDMEKEGENEKWLCKIRDIYKTIAQFEVDFEKKYNLGLNEGMLLCSLYKSELLSSGDIASTLGITHSNASKVIKSAEKKLLIERILGETDKRQMYFILTGEGVKRIESIKYDPLALPEPLAALIGK